MAQITDLPPEVRLKIYQLLLVDPIQEELRITLTFDPLDYNKTTWGRARCAHTKDHYTHPCHIKVPPFTMHHLDFTDLMALARINKKLYAEASQTIYNSADLTYSLGDLSPTSKSQELAPAFKPISLYLDKHSSTTCAMFSSLIINDKSLPTITSRDIKALVDLVNTRLPNLRVLGYQISKSTKSLISSRTRHLISSLSRVPKTLRPLARLMPNTSLRLELPFFERFRPENPICYPMLCIARQSLCDWYMLTTARIVQYRRLMHDRHILALNRGDYLQVTSNLRSPSGMEDQIDDEIVSIEETLVESHQLGDSIRKHRAWSDLIWGHARKMVDEEVWKQKEIQSKAVMDRIWSTCREMT